MKKLLVTLSILMSQSAFADDASALLKKQILDGKDWTGTYDAVYYREVAAPGGGTHYYYGSSDTADFTLGQSEMTLSFSMTPNGLTYNWDRDLLGSGETDDKTCAKQEITVIKKGKPVKKEVGAMLPRVIVLKQDLLDLVDAKAPAAVVPDVNKAEKAKIEATFAGIQAKLKLRDPVIALIKGKKCSEGVVGEDLNVPVLKIDIAADGQHMDILACLGNPEGYPTVMGYSVYSMDIKK